MKEAWTKAQAISFKGLKEVSGDESKVRAFDGELQFSFFVVGDLYATYTHDAEGHADEGWLIDQHAVSKM